MESRVESHGASMNGKPSLFHAGLSNKFTKRHITNFHDTTLAAASAAKARADLKMERQANTIEKQQEKIELEMKKIEAITERLQRQQAREANRLRGRLMYAASRIQIAFRRHVAQEDRKRRSAANEIQRRWRGVLDRELAHALAHERAEQLAHEAALVITRSLRIYVCRLVRHHEIKWREYAVMTIQCLVRQHQARRCVSALRASRVEIVRRDHAAVCIQSHTRGFLTRIVYLDVLYLVCRIQAVARGFLVRNRLRWLLSLNIHGIIALQAVLRGVIVRQRLRQLRQDSHHTRPVLTEDTTPKQQSRRPQDVLRQPIVRVPRQAASGLSKYSLKIQRSSTSSYSQTMRASMPSPAATGPERIKRSYWLPSGASQALPSTRRRLPHLPVRRSLPSPERVSGAMDEVATRVLQVQRLARGKQGKHRPPQRLEPIEHSLHNDFVRTTELERDEDAEATRRTLEERRMREDALKQKLMARRVHEKKRLELEMIVKLEQENEAKERKHMEREEKLMRLWLKATQRKHHELRVRRQTQEQQREERERMEMIREERLTLLHVKLSKRVAQEATNNTRKKGADAEALPLLLRADVRDEDEAMSLQQPVPRSVKAGPSVSKRSTKRSKPSGVATKKTRELRSVYGGGRLNNQSVAANESDLQAQYALWNFHSDTPRRMQPELVEDTAEFDYGDAFDDVVDEAQLKKLLC